MMRYLCLIVAAAILLAGLLPTSVLAYNSDQCNGKFVRWPGQSTTFDYASFIAEGWWQAEIIYANAIWDDPSVGANFDLIADSGSNNDWKKVYNPNSTRAGETAIYVSIFDCSEVTRTISAFNTRYNWAICDPSCPSDTYDVRSVAAHEFGHWLVLLDIPSWKFWDASCIMYPKGSPDRTLCGHDQAGIQEIYGIG